MWVSPWRPSSIKTEPSPEPVCNGPDPVHVWTTCDAPNCKGVFETPESFFHPNETHDNLTRELTTGPKGVTIFTSAFVCLFECLCVCVCVGVCAHTCVSQTHTEVLLRGELANGNFYKLPPEQSCKTTAVMIMGAYHSNIWNFLCIYVLIWMKCWSWKPCSILSYLVQRVAFDFRNL